MADFELLGYDIENGTHREPEEEWGFHAPQTAATQEWHYITLPMFGVNGRRYFFFITNFHFAGANYLKAVPNADQMGVDDAAFFSMTGLMDYTVDRFRLDKALCVQKVADSFDVERNETVIDGAIKSDWSYRGNQMHLDVSCKEFSFSVDLTGASRVLWAQDGLGKQGLIREGGVDDRSFYYSLTQLPYHGQLRYTEDDGTEVVTDVVGEGWVDRQWGDFMTKTWEWTSLRLGTGESINLYNFQGGYQVGSRQMPDGSCDYFDSFTVVQNGYVKSATPDNRWFSWGWDIVLPIDGGVTYHVVPQSNKEIFIGVINAFWEGLCDVIDESGRQVGYAVVESMEIRAMENGPYAKFQHNLPE